MMSTWSLRRVWGTAVLSALVVAVATTPVMSDPIEEIDPNSVPWCTAELWSSEYVPIAEGPHYIVWGSDSPVCATWMEGVYRWGGADRYEVSANIAAENFHEGVTVYVANGLASADALAAGPVAGITRGPIVLVKRDYIPAAVQTELTWLEPSRIVILGGTGSVSAAVETQLSAYTDSVVRWGGADRYEVAAAISAENFPDGAHTVYIANGLASADALSAGPVAGLDRSPILLVKSASIPSAVAAELERLDPAKVVILGGTGSVSETVEERLAQYATSVVRWGGADRYEVSARIAEENFPMGAGMVFVANGLASADALAAGPVATMDHGPVLLVRNSSIPAAVARELDRLNPSGIVVLGGLGSVSASVEERLASFARVHVTTEALPDGVVGVPYPSTQLTATGGTRPYGWSAVGLPDGLALSATGTLTGTPTAAGEFEVEITVTDADSVQASTWLILTVAGAPTG